MSTRVIPTCADQHPWAQSRRPIKVLRRSARSSEISVNACLPLTLRSDLEPDPGYPVSRHSASSAGCVSACSFGFPGSRAPGRSGFITGNLQKLGEEIVSWIWPSQGKQTKRESIIFVLAWFGYAMGAVAGTLAAGFINKPLIVAACILPFIMIGHESKS